MRFLTCYFTIGIALLIICYFLSCRKYKLSYSDNLGDALLVFLYLVTLSPIWPVVVTNTIRSLFKK